MLVSVPYDYTVIRIILAVSAFSQFTCHAEQVHSNNEIILSSESEVFVVQPSNTALGECTAFGPGPTGILFPTPDYSDICCTDAPCKPPKTIDSLMSLYKVMLHL
jgi:hypothetical protein